MKLSILLLAITPLLSAQKTGADTSIDNILEVKRIYVAPLTGGAQADALRDLIIASLTGTRLFILTDNPDRADAVLKGAADDKAFTDTYDSNESQTAHENVSKNNGGTPYIRASGLAIGDGGSMEESHHIKERKHEAYAAVRLCNKDGDVLWSTTQESLGAKFHGAGADVAARIARQITLDYEREKRHAQPGTLPPPGPSVIVK
jgi:hypothetical protein